MHPGDDETYGAELVPVGDLLDSQLEDLSRQERRGYDEFGRMGFSVSESLRLARAGAPWVRVERALLSDCTIELALEIWT